MGLEYLPLRTRFKLHMGGICENSRREWFEVDSDLPAVMSEKERIQGGGQYRLDRKFRLRPEFYIKLAMDDFP